MNMIEFDRAKLARLKTAYEAAKAAKTEQFEFEGHQLLVGFAKYMIEFLETQFKPDTQTVDARFTDPWLSKLDSMNDSAALVAARFTNALRDGWSPNKIMENVKKPNELPPGTEEWAKRILDVCLNERKNWP